MRLHELVPILDAFPDAVVVVDAAGVVDAANARAEALFGVEPGGLCGRAARALVGDADGEALDALLAGAGDTANLPNGVGPAGLSIDAADGTLVPALVLAAATGDSAGTSITVRGARAG